MILALDCATKTGWCLWNTSSDRISVNAIVESGTQDFSKQRGESNGAVFLKFKRWLTNMLGSGRMVHLIVYEQSHFRGGAATELCVGLTTRVQEIATELKIEYVTIHTGTLKKYAAGSGTAGKPEMIAAAAKVIGRQPVDDNEADAVMMAKWAAENYG